MHRKRERARCPHLNRESGGGERTGTGQKGTKYTHMPNRRRREEKQKKGGETAPRGNIDKTDNRTRRVHTSRKHRAHTSPASLSGGSLEIGTSQGELHGRVRVGRLLRPHDQHGRLVVSPGPYAPQQRAFPGLFRRPHDLCERTFRGPLELLLSRIARPKPARSPIPFAAERSNQGPLLPAWHARSEKARGHRRAAG